MNLLAHLILQARVNYGLNSCVTKLVYGVGSMTRKSILWGIGLFAGAVAVAVLSKKAIEVLEELDDSLDIDFANMHLWVWN